MNTLGLILVSCRDDLDDLVARELQLGDVRGAAVHQVRIKYTENGLVCNDEEIVLLPFELEDDRLEADG